MNTDIYIFHLYHLFDIENDLIWLSLNKQANSWNCICSHYSALSLEQLD